MRRVQVCFRGFWRGASFGQTAASGLPRVVPLVGAAGAASGDDRTRREPRGPAFQASYAGSIPATASSSGRRYFGRLGRQRLVASVGSLHTFGQHLGSDFDLVLEAIGAERPGLAAGEGATVKHGHGRILLHFSNNVPRFPMFMRSRRRIWVSPKRERPESTIENGRGGYPRDQGGPIVDRRTEPRGAR